MKALTSCLLVVVSACTFTSCTEVNPLGNANPVDTTTVVTQQKNILIEDITGVRCPNCPAAHVIAQQLQDENPGRVEVIAIHNGALSSPFPISQYNFQTTEGAAIDNYLGPADYWPKGAIDRKLYDGQNEVLLDRTVWTGIAAQRLGDTLKVAVDLNNSYNAANRKLDVTVTLNYLYDVADAQNITVYLTESGIVDPQEFPTYVDTFYVHNYVLRDALTDPLGDAVTETTGAGAQVVRNYNVTLPQTWVAGNCRVVAFVSRSTTGSKEVLQAAGKNVL